VAEVGHARAVDGDVRDRLWAQTHATSSTSAEAILRDYSSLCVGDSAAIRSFRSIFLERSFNGARHEGEVYDEPTRYLLFAPNVAGAEDRRPLVVWLHGTGDGEADLQHHLTWLARLFFPPPWQRSRYPFFFLSVLRPARYKSWSAAPGSADDMLDRVLAILDEIVGECPIDASRIAVVGASSGGTGCWEMVLRSPGRFAGVAPLASRGSDETRVRQIAGVPIWAFHCTGDKAVPIIGVRQTVRALKDAGGMVLLTEFESDDHDSWTPAFDDYDLLNWMLSQKLGDAKRYPPGSRSLSTRARPLVRAAATAAVWIAWLIIPLAAICVPLVLKLKGATQRKSLTLKAKSTEKTCQESRNDDRSSQGGEGR
jgi:predicted esterase